MPSNSSWRRDLQTIFNAGTLAGLSDGQLLERIAALRGAGREPETEAESAFALLIERHGPMVLRVCRGVLGDPHAADDAFQATFLVLLRRAGSIRKRESVGPWLHGVAHRIAAGARSAAARRRMHERRWFDRRQGAASGHASAADSRDLDLSSTIHAELDRLPERYRAPIVLCDLEERSLDEAARQLGWPLGTVKSRLNRGRQQLRDRLVRRGVAPGMAGLVLSGEALIRPADTAVSVSLAQTTAELIRSAGTATWGPSASVLNLARGVPRATIMGKLKTIGMGLALIGLSVLGIGYLASNLPPLDPPEDPAEAPFASTPTERTPRGIETKDGAEVGPNPPQVGESYLEAIDISGRATDPGGQPVVGATVYVIDWRDRRPDAAPGRSRLLTTTTTGPDGRFVARGVRLGVSPLNVERSARVGLFQIAATAPGFGLTWHEVIRVNPAVPRPSNWAKIASKWYVDLYQGEPIQVDLAFDLPATVRGRLVDDLGRPLAGVEVRVGICDDIRHVRRADGGKIWSCVRLDPTDKVPAERRSLQYMDSLPEALLSTRTRPDGTYRIDGLPREAQFLSLIDFGPEHEPVNPTIATTTRAIPGALSLGYDAVLDHSLPLPREIRLTVRYSDTDRPARNATVRARTERAMVRSRSVGATDDAGRTTLHLCPGDYELAIEPPLDAPYRPGRKSVTIGPENSAEFTDLKLDPAALVTLEAVDAKTGAGIEGVRFQYETDASRERRGLSSQLVVIDHPATDEGGRLRAVVEPGRRRFLVESTPPGWKFDGTSGAMLDLAAGRETTARFAFVKVEESAANGSPPGDSSGFPEELVETWRRQQHAARTGKFRIRRYFIGKIGLPRDETDALIRQGSISEAELDAFLNQSNLGEADDIAATIRARFPGLIVPDPISHEIIVDAARKRHVERGPETRRLDITIDNGLENMGYGSFSAETQIFKDGGNGQVGGLVDVRDFTYWPFLGSRPARSVATPGGGPAIRRTEGPDGRVILEREMGYGTARWIVDRATGFVHAHSSRTRMPHTQALGQEIRQYGPQVFANGAVLPKVHVEAHLTGDQVDHLLVKVVDEADLSYHPGPLDFVLSVPAGTLIVDKREDQVFPNKGITHYQIADVIAYADEMDARYRSIEPVLKIGRPAPPIRPAAWFDRNGPAEAPDLAGKVVLVDFWGITCASCMAELPEVQAAADRFAARSQDFVLIGLHNSGPTAGEGAVFARKQGLTFRLAIDRPTDDEGWPGATFQSYGIHTRAYPAAVVIDRQGRIAFVGKFREALQKAEGLLAR